MSNFRFQSEKVHLTYKTHIDPDVLKAKMKGGGRQVKMISIVHEEGDVDEEAATPYDHTHVFVWWVKRVETRDCRFFDVVCDDDVIHPNIKTRRGIDWAKLIVMKYHLGHKHKKDGKKYFIEPVLLVQEGVEEWKMEEDSWAIAEAAPSLKEACLDMGMVPKSIADVNLARREGKKRGFAEMEDDVDASKFTAAPAEWDRKKKSLVIAGPPGLGKTQWAISQFKGKAHLVTDIDDLKEMPAGCEGYVFDDCSFAKTPISIQKHVSDVRKGASIRCRHANGFKQKLPAIFLTNALDDLFDLDAHGGAVAARVHVWHITDKLF